MSKLWSTVVRKQKISQTLQENVCYYQSIFLEAESTEAVVEVWNIPMVINALLIYLTCIMSEWNRYIVETSFLLT